MQRCQPMAAWLIAGTILLGSSSWGQTTKPTYPESEAGLKQFFQDILSASDAKDAQKLVTMTQSLLLPDPEAWFKKTYGDELGAKLAVDYKNDHKNFGLSLARLFYNLKDPKTLEIEVTCIQALDDTGAKALQKLAIAAMKEPAPLYTASITKEGTGAHITLWSIVYVDGQFRLAGKMRAVKDAGDTTPDD